MCISRILLIILLPFLPVKTPVYRKTVEKVIMEDENTTGSYEHIWSDFIPSLRVFLTSVVMVLLIKLVISVILKMFCTILPRLPPVERQTSSPSEQRETDLDTRRCGGTVRDQTDCRVCLRGSESQEDGKKKYQNSSVTFYDTSVRFLQPEEGQNS